LTDYLKLFPEPFLDDIVQGRCLPFIGAGFSLNAKIPNGQVMLDWNGLGKKVSAALQDYQYTSAVEALSAYAHEFSRGKLVELLSKSLLITTIQPGKTHEEFCRLPFERVVTTNFDFLLEQAYSQINKYCIPQVSEDQLAIGDTTKAGVKLLKLHGDLHHPSRLVVTEEDYDSFLARLPLLATHLSSLLIDHTAFFIGYSLDDPDFRQIWNVVKDRLGDLRRQAYVLQFDAPAHTVARYERRGVKVINLTKFPNRTYAESLEIVFREIREYWSSKVISQSTATEPELQAELSLPLAAQSRLAFFSVPTIYAAAYKSHIYPIAEKFGFSPIMAVDVATHGDNLMAKIYALIRKSALVVADLSSPNTIYELGIAMSDEGASKPLILIAEEGLTIPFDISNHNVIKKPKSIEDDSNDFFKLLENAFEKAFAKISPSLEDEPSRLLGKKEFRAAIIASFALLEHDLRQYYESTGLDAFAARSSLSMFLEFARSKDILTGKEVKLINSHAIIRNRIAHSREDVPEALAKPIVREVSIIISKIREAKQNKLIAVI
jgi:hypothetical protein